MNWEYQGRELLEAPLDVFGFVYRITNLVDGRIYIGKKLFSFSVKKRLSKKARKGTRKKSVRTTKDSGWISYYGSSLTLKEDIKTLGSDNFRREILHFGKSKTELSYLEVVEQINHKVLLTDSYNSWISCRIFKKYL